MNFNLTFKVICIKGRYILVHGISNTFDQYSFISCCRNSTPLSLSLYHLTSLFPSLISYAIMTPTMLYCCCVVSMDTCIHMYHTINKNEHMESWENSPTPNPSGVTGANPPIRMAGLDTVEVDRMMWFSFW